MKWINWTPTLVLTISAFGQVFDGPAELPRTTPATTFVFPNPPKTVSASESLQAAINAASCGDTLNVDPASVTTVTGKFVGPNCTAALPMNIESAAPITLDNVTGRVIPGQQLPKIVLLNSNSCVDSGSGVRWAGFEITRPPNTGVVYSLVCPRSGAHDYIFDMDYIHGTSTDETQRGIQLSNSYNGAIINSVFLEFHCLAIVGSCSDAQAINGGLDTSVCGYGYLIQDNTLEASGENVLFGGGKALCVPTDIKITGNLLYKPDTWNQSDPSFIPAALNIKCPNGECAWAAKNLVELKNARRVLIEHNTMYGSWAGFTQPGYAVLLTAKNDGTCPACAVEDVTYRFNKSSHTGGAIVTGCGKSDNGFWPAGCGFYSIHDAAFDDLENQQCPGCASWSLEIASGYDPVNGTPVVLHDVRIDHVSLLQNGYTPIIPHTGDGGARGFLLLAGPPPNTLGIPLLTNINLTNIVTYAGNNPVYSTGGGTNNCASVIGISDLTKLFSTCFAGNSSVTNNLILTPGNTKTQNQNWPAGNTLLNIGANIN